MGYTIYMRLPNNKVKAKDLFNDSVWEDTCDFIRKGWAKIPKKYKDDENSPYDIEFNGLGNGLGKGEPDFSNDHICFNGKGEDSCETFYFGAYERLEGLDAFCKTERKGYTMAVMIAILCIKKFFNPALEYDSDGYDEAAWKKAKQIVSKL